MTLVLIILAIVWVAVLLPPALRKRAESRPADSISAFKRQLTTLRRSQPGQPRNSRMRARGGSDTVVAFQPQRSSRRPVSSRPATRGPSTAPPVRGGRPVGPGARARNRTVASRPTSRTIKRRRDIFVALVTASLATLVLGLAVDSLRVMLLAHVITDVLLTAYVALLVRQRNVLAERDMKVRFLPRPQSVQPALLRRSVN